MGDQRGFKRFARDKIRKSAIYRGLFQAQEKFKLLRGGQRYNPFLLMRGLHNGNFPQN